MKHLSHDDLRTLPILLGGMALLIIAALFISGKDGPSARIGPTSLLANMCWLIHSSSCNSSFSCSAQIVPSTVSPGQQTSIRWTGSHGTSVVIRNLTTNTTISWEEDEEGDASEWISSKYPQANSYPITATQTSDIGVCHLNSNRQWVCPCGARVTVTALTSPIVVSLDPETSSVPAGNSQTLTYSKTGGSATDTCFITGGVFGASPGSSVGHSGSAGTGALTESTSYGYHCYDTARSLWVTDTATVNVAAQCAQGFESGANGVCTPISQCSGANEIGTPPNCVCDVGYERQGGACISQLCTGPHEVGFDDNCQCDTGFTRDALGVCVHDGVIDSLNASPVRVRAGERTTLSWQTQHMATCELRNNLNALISSDLRSNSTEVTIHSATIFTLSCIDAAGVSRTQNIQVTILPFFQEL